MRLLTIIVAALLIPFNALAQSTRTVDIPTSSGVTQRILVITPDKPRAAVVLFAGGDGGMRVHGANHSWRTLYSLTRRVEKQPGADVKPVDRSAREPAFFEKRLFLSSG